MEKRFIEQFRYEGLSRPKGSVDVKKFVAFKATNKILVVSCDSYPRQILCIGCDQWVFDVVAAAVAVAATEE